MPLVKTPYCFNRWHGSASILDLTNLQIDLQRIIIVSSRAKPAEAPKSDRFSLLVATPSHLGMFCKDYLLGIVGIQTNCLTHASALI
jgi:hypothetical protein